MFMIIIIGVIWLQIAKNNAVLGPDAASSLC